MDGETMVWMRREGERQEECDFFGAVGLHVETGNTITSITSNQPYFFIIN